MIDNLATDMPLNLDYRSAFDLAPIGLVISARRLIVDCNQQLLSMFAASREQLIGQSFEVLYPSPAEFERTGERIAARLDAQGFYADERGDEAAGFGAAVLVPCVRPRAEPGGPACRGDMEF